MIGIETKILPATATQPRRICAFTCNGHRLVTSYDDSGTDAQAHFKAAQALIKAQFKYSEVPQRMTYGGTRLGYFFCWPNSVIS